MTVTNFIDPTDNQIKKLISKTKTKIRDITSCLKKVEGTYEKLLNVETKQFGDSIKWYAILKNDVNLFTR